MADDVLAALEESAAAQAVKVRTTDKETGETVIRKRPLRSDAVIGAAVIYKPPCAVARGWTREQYDKFISDSREVMAAIQCGGETDEKTGRPKRGREPCRLFGTGNIVASAEHWDEGSEDEDPDYEGVYTGHWHDVYVPKDEDGKYRGNLIDMYFLSRVSRQYPAMMRDRGWGIEDCDCTDWERWNSDPEYRAERKSRIRQGGKSTNRHIAGEKRKAAAAKLAEAQDMLGQAAALDEARLEAEAESAVLLARARRRAEAERLDAEVDVAVLMVNAKADADKVRAAAQEAAAESKREQAQAETGRDRAKREAAGAEAVRDKARQETADAEAARDKARKDAADAEANRDRARKSAADAETARDEA